MIVPQQTPTLAPTLPVQPEHWLLPYMLAEVDAGRGVFVTAPMSKKPLKGSRGFKDATTDPAEIRRMLEQNPKTTAYGVVPGPDQIVADTDPRNYPLCISPYSATGESLADLSTLSEDDLEEIMSHYPEAKSTDDPNNRWPIIELPNGKRVRDIFDEDFYSELPDGRKVINLGERLLGRHPECTKTRIVGTPQGGRHYYLTKPADWKVENLQAKYPGIDFISEHPYVLGPGSRTDKGEYVLIQDAPLAELAADPDLTVKSVASTKTREADFADNSEAVQQRAITILESYGTVPNGKRHPVIIKAALRLWAEGLDVEIIDDLIRGHLKFAVRPPEDHITRRVESILRNPRVPQGINHPDAKERVLDQFAPEPGAANAYAAAATDWPELKPLQRELDPPAPYPLDALGTTLGAAAKETQEIIQAPDGICGSSFLAAAALGVQGLSDVVIDGRRCPTSLFLLSIAESGERKSAVDNIALYPVYSRQQQMSLLTKNEQQAYALAKTAYDSALTEGLRKTRGQGCAAKEAALKALGPAPEPPLEKFLVFQDMTYEGVFKGFLSGLPSQGLFADEGGLIVGGHAMNADNELKTGCGLSNLWDGNKPVTKSRGGDGREGLFGRRLSFHLMMQPEVSTKILGNQLLRGQGLLSRILTCYPTSTSGSRPYRPVDPASVPEIKAYTARMMQLLELPLPLREGTRNELAPPWLQLSLEAKLLWTSFYNDVERELRTDGKYAAIRGFANKAPEHALRIAGVLTLFNKAEAGYIDPNTMSAGIDLTRYYLSEAVRLFSGMQTDAELTQAQMLLRWLRAQQRQVISHVEIYKNGPGSVRTEKAARKLIDVLLAHGYVRQAAPVEFEGTMRKLAWEIRPA